jgi:hypothetical protein
MLANTASKLAGGSVMASMSCCQTFAAGDRACHRDELGAAVEPHGQDCDHARPEAEIEDAIRRDPDDCSEDCVVRPLHRFRERLLCRSRRVIALGHVVLSASHRGAGAQHPWLAQDEHLTTGRVHSFRQAGISDAR